MAVNAHGYLRFTHGIDLVIDLHPDNILPAFRALASLGYKPRVPVTAAQFADVAQRQQWITEKGMRVLNFYSDQHRETPLDIFVTEPFDFDSEYARAPKQELIPGVFVHFASIPTPIAMKEVANRPTDVDDIEPLRWIMEEQHRDK